MTTAATAAHDTHAHPSRFHLFMQVAMILAILTGIEIVIIFIPVSDFMQYFVLIGLSVIKFFAVIFYFMHLRWDKAFCTILFFIGLILGGGTMAALLALFKTDRTEATADAELSALVAPATLDEARLG